MSKNISSSTGAEITGVESEHSNSQDNYLESDQSALNAAQTKWETCVVDAKELTKEIAALVVFFNLSIFRLGCMISKQISQKYMPKKLPV